MRDLVAALFAPVSTAGATPRSNAAIGAELELIPVHSESKGRVRIHGEPGRPGAAEVIRAATGMTRGLSETVDAYGAPAWDITAGGRISFEPGGQIEISSPVCDSADALVQFLRGIVGQLRLAAAGFGIDLLAVGVDPYNSIDRVQAQLHAPRYDAMALHFDSIGPAGVAMMRQTASLQISVELGPRPFERWRLLNALAPYLTAAFANSRLHAGRDTGHASHRALLWQQLDRSRTGLAYSATDPVGAYTTFAERAARILSDDAAHLTTLFPEVRPRGYFEIRSIDSVELHRAAQAIRLVSALALDNSATAAALELLGDPDMAMLYRAATAGRADRLIRSRLKQLETIAGVAIPE